MDETWTRLRNFLRLFRGVSKWCLSQYVAVFQWGQDIKEVSDQFIELMLGTGPHTEFDPWALSGQAERKAYNSELEIVNEKFAAISFDATVHADEGKEIVRLFEAKPGVATRNRPSAIYNNMLNK